MILQDDKQPDVSLNSVEQHLDPVPSNEPNVAQKEV